MMMVLGIGFVALGAMPRLAHAGWYIVYIQGRGWGSWNTEVANVPGWTNVTLSFNGSASIAGSGGATTTVKNAIATYCSGGNYCVLHCESAGCLRMQKAIYDLRYSYGNNLPGLQWVMASCSAAGGTHLAEVSTQGFTSLIAKLLGQQEKVDFDLTPSAARGTWGYTQGTIGAYMYHSGGNKDICKGIWPFKFCGNSYISGVADGVVGLDSSAGYSSAGSYTSGCLTGKYSWHTWHGSSPCGGENRDHFGMPGRGDQLIAAWGNGAANDQNMSWSDNITGLPGCVNSNGQCDTAFSDQGQNYHNKVDHTSVATTQAPVASGTTGTTRAGSCFGKCGSYAGNSCYCDALCVSNGDCCSDYSAANCANVNAQ
jgi:Somatomedin B domain